MCFLLISRGLNFGILCNRRLFFWSIIILIVLSFWNLLYMTGKIWLEMEEIQMSALIIIDWTTRKKKRRKSFKNSAGIFFKFPIAQEIFFHILFRFFIRQQKYMNYFLLPIRFIYFLIRVPLGEFLLHHTLRWLSRSK